MKTIQAIKCLPIRAYLAQRGLHPTKDNPRYGLYRSPLREERTPSFKVDYGQNLWYDFGLGVGGSIIDLVMRLERCDFTQAVRLLGGGGRTAIPTPASTSALPTVPALRILSDMPLRHPGIGRLSVITRNRFGNRIDPLPGGALCRWRTFVFRCRIPQRCRRLGAAFGTIQRLCVAQTDYDD